MLQINTGTLKFNIEKHDDQWTIDNRDIAADIQPLDDRTFSVLYNGKSYTAIVEQIDKNAKTVTLLIDTQRYEMSIEEPLDQLIKSMGIDLQAGKKAETIKAPMPGLILQVLVAEGQQVHKGDNLLILEAMKMENMIKAPATATIKKICISEKTAVEKGVALIELE